MLELRPTCENCNKALPVDSTDARICSFECTFCAQCVDSILGNVCPNCGGGFCPRPIRPSQNWKDGNFVGEKPPGFKSVYRPVDHEDHAKFSAKIRSIPPERRWMDGMTVHGRRDEGLGTNCGAPVDGLSFRPFELDDCHQLPRRTRVDLEA